MTEHFILCLTLWEKGAGRRLPGSVIRQCATCKAAVWLPGRHIPNADDKGYKLTCMACFVAHEGDGEEIIQADPGIVEDVSIAYGQAVTAEQLVKIGAATLATLRKQRS